MQTPSNLDPHSALAGHNSPAESPLRYIAEISFRLDQANLEPLQRGEIEQALTHLNAPMLRALSSLWNQLDAVSRRALILNWSRLDSSTTQAVGSYAKRLNGEQLRALFHVHEIAGPLLILAGAGSGKTTVLTRRVAYLLATGVPEESILAVTFTRKAAAEMAERLEKLLSDTLPSRFFDIRKLWISTFHSACTRLLRDSVAGIPNMERLGYKHQKFAAADEPLQLSVIAEALTAVPGAREIYTPPRALELISDAKQKLLDPEGLAESGDDPDPQKRLTSVYRGYQRRLAAANALDFDDMICLAVKLLESDVDVRSHYQSRFTHLLVDEYQDTNLAQYRLTRLLIGDRNELFVVGDDDQAIYAFRGADIRNILEFRKDFPLAHTVKLESNYRSRTKIIEAANKIFDKKDKSLQKTLRVGRSVDESEQDERRDGSILRFTAADERDEAQFVAEEIQVGRNAGQAWSDFAVLYRVNAQAEPFCNVFEAAGIPYSVAGGRIVDHEIVQDVVALLELVDFELRLQRKEPRQYGPVEGHDFFQRVLLVEDTRFRFNTMTFQLANSWKPDDERLARCPECLRFLTDSDAMICEECRAEFERPLHGMSGYEALAHNSGSERVAYYRRRFERHGFWDHMEQLLQMIRRLASVAEEADVEEFLEIALAEWGLRTRLRGALDPDARERHQKLEALLELAAEFDDSYSESLEQDIGDGRLRKFLKYLLEGTGQGDRVTLSTLHSAKGLEWPTVFYVGLEDGLSPSTPRAKPGRTLSLEDIKRQRDEEERLFYVGITRTRDVLYLTHAFERQLYGRRKKASPSPYLDRIPRELVQEKHRPRARGRVLREGLQHAAKLTSARHRRSRVREILEAGRTASRNAPPAQHIEPRVLDPAGRGPGMLLVYPDPHGLTAAAQALRALPKAEVRFSYPSDLAAELDVLSGRAKEFRTLLLLGLPLHGEHLDPVLAALHLVRETGASTIWYDHHPWSDGALHDVEAAVEDLVVAPNAGSVTSIVSQRLLPGDELADRMARLLADHLGPAEEDWGLNWACLLQELSARRYSGSAWGTRRRRSAVEQFAWDRPLRLGERLLVRRNIARRLLGDEIAQLPHRIELTESGHKFLVIDLRRWHRDISERGQVQHVFLYLRPGAEPISRRACRIREAKFAVCVHGPDRYSVFRHPDGAMDMRPLLELRELDGRRPPRPGRSKATIVVRADGHEDTIGMRLELGRAERWWARLSSNLPACAERLITEVRTRL